jgi:hypothetical protein
VAHAAKGFDCDERDLSIDHASETAYSGYNQPVEIALPEEAKKAELLEETA